MFISVCHCTACNTGVHQGMLLLYLQYVLALV